MSEVEISDEVKEATSCSCNSKGEHQDSVLTNKNDVVSNTDKNGSIVKLKSFTSQKNEAQKQSEHSKPNKPEELEVDDTEPLHTLVICRQTLEPVRTSTTGKSLNELLERVFYVVLIVSIILVVISVITYLYAEVEMQEGFLRYHIIRTNLAYKQMLAC